MQTLSYGFQKPVTNDRGNVVFPALEANWQQVNDHTHDGINSAPIASAFVAKTKKSILAAAWTEVAGGHYTQVVTLPLNLEYDNVTLSFRTAAGAEVHPTITKASATQFNIFFDDPSLDLVALVN
jgi:hypothetical protein